MNLANLRRFDNDLLPGQSTDRASPDPVIAGEDPSEDKFEVTHILNAHINRQYCGGRLPFRVAWRGWLDSPTWYNADDGDFSHTKHALDEFYELPPTKVLPSRSAGICLPSSPIDKTQDEPFFPGGGAVMGCRPSTRPLRTPTSYP